MLKPAECAGCPLESALGPCWGSGPKDANIMLVGEAPGPDEVEANPPQPFVGRAGWLLNIGLQAAGVSRRLCYVSNTVKCMPYVGGDKHKFRKPTKAEVAFCAVRWLKRELDEVKPNVVVAMGDTAAGWLTQGHRLAVTGEPGRGVLALRGVVLDVGQRQ